MRFLAREIALRDGSSIAMLCLVKSLAAASLTEEISRVRSEGFPTHSHQADVWFLAADMTNEISNQIVMLSDLERLRAVGFRSSVDRNRFISTHWALRSVLAAYCKVDPESLVFGANIFGKPHLMTPQNNIAFNLSHSGCYGTIVITNGMPCGIDIENIRRPAATDAIAANYFSRPENEWLCHLSEEERVAEFFRIWTLKEATLKALGTGLSSDISKINVMAFLKGYDAYIDSGYEQTRYWARQLNLAEDYMAAVVIQGLPHEIKIIADYDTELEM
jgi:4'-phosphopantetheinyl transferase